MSIASVRAFFAEHASDLEVLENGASTATVREAANALGVTDGQIAKTLSLRVDDRVILLVTRGDARLDNRKYKDQFGTKARMLPASEVLEITGHPVGGVCPFGLAQPLEVYCDISLRAFDEVFPAAGAPNAAVRIGTDRLAEVTRAKWVDVTQQGD